MQYQIVIYPFWTSNPYQSLLQDGLSGRGHKVVRETMAPKTLPFHLIGKALKGDVLNLHWFAHMYEGRSRFRFAARTMLFCLTLSIIRMLGTRVVVTLHNLVPHDCALRPCHIKARKVIFLFVNAVVVHSEPAKRLAVRHLGSERKFHVIPHGHYRGYYPDDRDHAAARASLEIDPARNVLLFFGEIKPYKGLEALLQWFRNLEDDGWTLLIAGKCEDPAYLTSLENSAPRNTSIHGKFIPDRDVQLYMRAADCIVLPYRQSLTSGVAVLALSFDLPIIAADNVAFHHLVERKLCAVFDPDDPDSMTRALDEVTAWPRDRFLGRCRSFLAECSWENVAVRHERVFRS